MSALFGASIVVGLSIAVTLLLVILIRTRWNSNQIAGTTDPEATYVTTLGTVYAIFVAFMIFVVWTRYYESMENVDREANTLVDIYNLSKGLPQPLKGQIEQSCINYTDIVVNKEWAKMQSGSKNSPTLPEVHRMWTLIERMSTDSSIDSVLRSQIIDRWLNFADYRRLRLLQSRTGLPDLLYIVLLLGGALTVATAIVFNSENQIVHALKACLLAALISLMLYTIFTIDWPFQGAVHVSPSPFQNSLATMRQKH